MARAAVGVALMALGVWLVIRPLTSIAALGIYVAASFVVMGIGELARASRSALQGVLAIAWIGVGVVALLLRSSLIDALPVLIGVYLIVYGLVKSWSGRRAPVPERISAVLLGLTAVVFGVVALSWQDLTLLIAAALFGVVLVVHGVALVWDALVHRDRPAKTDVPVADGDQPKSWRRWGKVAASAAALIAAVVALTVSGALHRGEPRPDAFYAAPAEVPPRPGVLLRSEPFTTEVPSSARAWRILYTTTNTFGAPTIASGIVVVPAAPSQTPRPVIAWAHGTTGYARSCAPSLLPQPFTTGALSDMMGPALANGWAIVATDYAGMGTTGPQPYIIGSGEARSVLDSVRAARSLSEANLATDKTVVWGHSQGGGAALWTDQEQPSYAPDVPLLGTVAMAPAADPLALARSLPNVTGGSVFLSYVASAYSDTYGLAMTDFIKPAAVPLVKAISSRCLSGPQVLASAVTSISTSDQNFLSGDPGSGKLGDLLRQNTPHDPGPGPLFIAHGQDDPLIPSRAVDDYVAGLRATGHQVEFVDYPGRDHMSLVQAGSPFLPQLVAWTRDRIDAAR